MTEQQNPLPKAQSPLPKGQKQETMSFGDALLRVTEGKKITRLEWNDKEAYGILQNTFLTLHKSDGKFYTWTVNDGDILAVDWIVI